MSTIPKLAFDPAEHSEDARIGAWVRYMSYMHKVAPIEVPGRGFAADAQSWVIDRMVISHVNFDAQTIVSTQGSSTVKGAPDILFGWFLKHGSAQVWHDGELLDVREDAFYLFDYSREYLSIAPQSEVISIMIPHGAAGYDPIRHAPRYILERASLEGELIVEELERVVRDGDTMTRQDVPEQAERFVAMFAALFHRRSKSEAETLSVSEQIKRYIDARVLDEDLSVEQVTKGLNVSRGDIYAALGLSQTFESYIVKRRLDYALRSLAFGPPNKARLWSIAEASKYTSLTDFADAFEAQFNLPPDAVLGVVDVQAQTGRVPEAETLWETWLNGA